MKSFSLALTKTSSTRLRSLALAIFLASFCVIPVGCANSAGDGFSGFEIELEIDQGALADAEVVLNARITNRSNSAIEFLTWNTPFEAGLLGGHFKVYSLEEGAQSELEYVGLMVKRSPPQPKDFRRLEAGGSLNNKQNVTKGYNFCRSKRYKLEFVGSILNFEWEPLDTRAAMVTFETGPSFPECKS